MDLFMRTTMLLWFHSSRESFKIRMCDHPRCQRARGCTCLLDGYRRCCFRWLFQLKDLVFESCSQLKISWAVAFHRSSMKYNTITVTLHAWCVASWTTCANRIVKSFLVQIIQVEFGNSDYRIKLFLVYLWLHEQKMEKRKFKAYHSKLSRFPR